MTSKEPTGGKQATGIELTQVMPEKTLEEKIREEEEKLKQLKKKSMDSWADTGEKKSFGLSGMLAFTLPRLWKGGCGQKFIVIFNILIVFILQAVNVVVPLVLKEVVDAIVCEEDKVTKTDSFLFRAADTGCPTE